MVMKILILIFFFEIKESKITRGHNYTLVKKQSRLDVIKFSFSQRTTAAYPELVSGGVSKSHKCKWLVKVSVPVRVSLG